MILVFKPFLGVGPFEFGDNISKYLGIYQLNYEGGRNQGYDAYIMEEKGIELYIENEILEAINCFEECLYKGRNIIGMYIEEFMKYYDLTPSGEVDELDFEEDNIPQFVYEFDEIGLQVWVKQNRILNVIASGETEDSEEPDEREQNLY